MTQIQSLFPNLDESVPANGTNQEDQLLTCNENSVVNELCYVYRTSGHEVYY